MPSRQAVDAHAVSDILERRATVRARNALHGTADKDDCMWKEILITVCSC